MPIFGAGNGRSTHIAQDIQDTTTAGNIRDAVGASGTARIADGFARDGVTGAARAGKQVLRELTGAQMFFEYTLSKQGMQLKTANRVINEKNS